MLQQCIQLLTLHIMWKSKRILSGAGADPLPEEVNDRDNLFNQRGALLEKLVEYAVGTQVQGNGIVEGVKRVVRVLQGMLFFHLIITVVHRLSRTF